MCASDLLHFLANSLPERKARERKTSPISKGTKKPVSEGTAVLRGLPWGKRQWAQFAWGDGESPEDSFIKQITSYSGQ